MCTYLIFLVKYYKVTYNTLNFFRIFKSRSVELKHVCRIIAYSIAIAGAKSILFVTHVLMSHAVQRGETRYPATKMSANVHNQA